MAASYQPVPLREDEPAASQEPPRSKRATIAAASLVMCAVGATLAVGTNNGTWVTLDETYTSAGLTLAVTNEYGVLASKSMYNWKHIAEPHRISTLSAAALSDTLDTSEYTYDWTIEHTEDDSTVTSDYAESSTALATVEYGFQKAGTEYTVTVTATSPSGEKSLTMTETVMCKYVRRELRQLTTKDRERFLAATATFHRMDAKEGRAKYGVKFTNYQEATIKHLSKMTLDGCTPYHGYDTFFTAHEAFVLEFEQALQTIDPAISAPFWDYTIDSTKYGHVGEIAAKSEIFTYDWFGPLDNSANNDVLTSKYFSSLPLPLDKTAPEHNGFGIVTDSINANPSMYVERFSSVCGLPSKSMLAGCTELNSIFSTNSLSAFRSQVETIYHASLHMSLGGAQECAFSLADAVADTSQGGPDRPALYEAIGLMSNTIWRTMELGKLMRCPSDCDLETDSFADCACSSPSVDKWGDSEKYELGYNELDNFGVIQMLSSEASTADYFEVDSDSGLTKVSGATVGEDKLFWKWLVDFSVHPGKLSPFATPLAATNDPIFWVSHAAWGRYWHYMRLNPTLKEDFHMEWTDPTVASWMDGDMAVSDCEDMLKETDTLPFKGFTEDGDSDAYATAEKYTNADLLALFSPDNVKLPYMYADFDWSHCEA